MKNNIITKREKVIPANFEPMEKLKKRINEEYVSIF
jgi:hypothetical protein